jgi:hypothetical protein
VQTRSHVHIQFQSCAVSHSPQHALREHEKPICVHLWGTCAPIVLCASLGLVLRPSLLPGALFPQCLSFLASLPVWHTYLSLPLSSLTGPGSKLYTTTPYLKHESIERLTGRGFQSSHYHATCGLCSYNATRYWAFRARRCAESRQSAIPAWRGHLTVLPKMRTIAVLARSLCSG